MILIVEDEILIRATLSDYLQDRGLKVLEAFERRPKRWNPEGRPDDDRTGVYRRHAAW